MGDCGSVHQIPTIWSVSPEHLYCEGAPRARARARSRLVLPFPDPSQVGSKKKNQDPHGSNEKEKCEN